MRDNDDIHHFGSRRYPPTVKELSNFEKDLLGIMDNMQIKRTKSGFQKEMSVKVKENKRTKKILVIGDKTKKYIFNEP